jgi:hypothetical protein
MMESNQQISENEFLNLTYPNGHSLIIEDINRWKSNLIGILKGQLKN